MTARDTNRASPWFFRPRPAPDASHRLICFPCAGYSAAMFRTWPAGLPAHVELVAVQPPGRATRFAEPAFESIPALVADLLSALSAITDKPYALFGHSMGAVVAAYAAAALAEAGAPAPLRLFLSARQPPDRPSPVPPVSHLSDDAFVEELQTRYGGIPEEILREPDMMALLLPTLRADIRALEATEGESPVPLPAPITAFGGVADRLVPADLLEGWAGWTAHGFDMRLFPGGHFYLEPSERALLAHIAASLGVGRPAPATAAPGRTP
ncbi:MAG: alpha/beta fold hydrolase [Pseudomonadota bacterium]